MTATPPGWYDDGSGAQRWWDGAQWTEHVQPAAPAPAPAAPAFAAPVAQSPVAAPAAAPISPPSTPTDAAPGAWPGAAGAPAGVYPAAGGYPAYPPVAPTKRSKLWILWVVLGVVVLFSVIGAIIAIPMFLLAVGSNAPSVDDGTLTPDETAAVATVQLYDQAWQEADCDLFFAVTTEAFRDDIELTDCESFVDDARGFADTTDDYELTVTGTWTDEDGITVATDEAYTTTIDEDGEPLDAPQSVVDLWEYYLIDSGDAWVIDGAVPQE